MMAELIETTNAATIDAVSLSEVINLKKDHDIMQLSCNNLCARIGCVAFLLARLGDDMAGFWGQSHFRTMAGKPI